MNNDVNWPTKSDQLRSEDEIIDSWGGALNPLVSIICAAYNHEKYIREAIESFLIQETDFPFEIVIHDDASTDLTTDIILEYAYRYPKVIHPIIQSENQYSRGHRIVSLAIPHSSGELLALCEGDDYWTDKKKLCKQVHCLNIYRTSDICFHSAYRRKDDGDQLYGPICVASNEDALISIEKVIIGGGGYMPTASILFRKEIASNIGDWFDKYAPVGDLFWQIYGSERGGAVYINSPMSVYRGHATSWNASMRNLDKKVTFEEKFIISLVAARRELSSISSSFDKFIYSHYRGLIFGARRNRQEVIYSLGIKIIQENSYILDNSAKKIFFILFKNKVACFLLAWSDYYYNLVFRAYRRLASPGLMRWLEYKILGKLSEAKKHHRS